MTEARYYIGLDLGQSCDYTALAVVERRGVQMVPGASACRGPARSGRSAYDVRHLERFPLGTPYPAIVGRVAALLTATPLAGLELRLVVDATGVGARVVDLFIGAGLPVPVIPVTITGGAKVTQDGRSLRVPKRELVMATKALLQSGRLRFAGGLAETPILVKELLNFQVRIDPRTAHDSYAVWREGMHDDLVLAVAMAVWYAERVAKICSGYG